MNPHVLSGDTSTSSWRVCHSTTRTSKRSPVHLVGLLGFPGVTALLLTAEPRTGIEPMTFPLRGGRSGQLSYRGLSAGGSNLILRGRRAGDALRPVTFPGCQHSSPAWIRTKIPGTRARCCCQVELQGISRRGGIRTRIRPLLRRPALPVGLTRPQMLLFQPRLMAEVSRCSVPTRLTSHRRPGSSEFFRVIRSPAFTLAGTQQVSRVVPDLRSTWTSFSATCAARELNPQLPG